MAYADNRVDVPFSRRLDWSRAENALAAAERRARDRGPLHDLTESNPTRVGLEASPGALGRALADARSEIYQPTARGARPARQAIAEAYAAAGTPLDPERLLLTASSSESYALLFKLLGDPGDVVLIPEPSYPLFDYLARLEGLTTLSYRLTYEGAWHLDLASVDEAFAAAARSGRRVSALIVVSPNNPTGSVLRAEEAAALERRSAAHGVAVIADEVFADFVRRPAADHVRCLAARPGSDALTFSLGGLSKSCGLPQLKLGWIAVGGPPEAAQAALDRLELIADTYLSVNTPVERALPDLLSLGATLRRAIAARIAENHRHLELALGPASPITLLKSDGGWSAIVRVPALHADDATPADEAGALRLLERDRVLVQPGYFFDLRDGSFLVLSLLPRPDTFTEGARRLIARIEGDSLAVGR